MKLTVSTLTAAVLAFGLASSASAATVVNDYDDALASVDRDTTIALPAGSTFISAPGVFNSSVSGDYRSPFEAVSTEVDIDGDAYTGSEDYYSIGFDYGTNPVELTFDALQAGFSLLWGSPDGYNELTFFKGGDQVGSVFTGTSLGLTSVASEASFVALDQTDIGGFFDSVKFRTVGKNAFEFSNVQATPVPLPAAAWLLLSGLGGLAAMRRRKKA